jgi:drug/metabolite transporter (DMT)-like permease
MVAIKVALVAFPPFALAGFRFILGGVTILAWALLQRISIGTTPQELILHAINALIFIAEVGIMNIGVQHTLASHSVVLFYTYPFFVALLAHLFLREDRLTLRRGSGMLLAFGGVIAVFSNQHWVGAQSLLIGDLIILLSALLLSIQTIYVKKIARTIEPIHIVLWQCFLGVPGFFLLSFWWEQGGGESLSPAIIWALVYQGVVVAGFCFLAWTVLIRDYPPTWVSSFFMSTPLFGVIFSALVLGESLRGNLILGALLVASGLYVITHPEKQRKTLRKPNR